MKKQSMDFRRSRWAGRRTEFHTRRLPLIPLACSLLFLLFFLSGCGGGRAENPKPYLLYFLDGDMRNREFHAGIGALQTEVSAMTRPELSAAKNTPSPENLPSREGLSLPEQTALSLLSELIRGPEGDGLAPVFPDGTSLLSLRVVNGEAEVNFSAQYSSLSGVALTLADYAVTLTLTQVPEITVVRILVQGQPLAYRNQQTFTPRDVLLDPEDDIVGVVDAALFFPDENGVLVREERSLSLYEGDTLVEAVVHALEEGPENRKLLPVFPDGFRVRSVWQEENICFVNLPAALLPLLTEHMDITLFFLALDESLSALDSVGEVRYLVDNEFSSEYEDAPMPGLSPGAD